MASRRKDRDAFYKALHELELAHRKDGEFVAGAVELITKIVEFEGKPWYDPARRWRCQRFMRQFKEYFEPEE